MIASSYPLLDAFWTMLWFFAFIAWIWVLIAIFTDIFRSHDIGGFAKAMWFIFVLFIPLLGVLVYLIARGRSMQERALERAQQQQQAFDQYVQERANAAGTSNADQLSKLAQLKSSGAITDAEYESEKAKLLAS
jgi:type VI protein secretion system component VasK